MAPWPHGAEPVLAVHSAEYVAFLERAYERWVAAGGAPQGVMPSTFALRRFGRHSPDALGEPGYYCFDLSGVIVPGTYAAARAAADTALSAADALLAGERHAYALCRPPGHHAGRDIYGGYCFLNNAAIAAHYLSPTNRVAVLDIDFHHGNGTQDIFYERADVLYVSIHADPARHYPYFVGLADERGAAAGEGFNLNLPLERGVSNERYLAALDQALEAVAAFAPRWLVVSAGFDTYAEDPVARNDFALTGEAFAQIGARIASLRLPTLHVQEGGYAVEALGDNVVSYLQGVEAGAR
jgi:acetoin utilization deacetylase AcuC-like enzyme